MPVTTTSAALHIAPVVVKTFLAHAKKKAKCINGSPPDETTALDDIFFDEAFHIVKGKVQASPKTKAERRTHESYLAFIELGTKNTIESLQSFTNTHVPAPYWSLVCPVTIPLSSCNDAADALIEWFGPEDLKYVVGGERWWQVRGLSGIDAEWVAERQDISSAPPKPKNGTKRSNLEADLSRMENLETVMLYVHGGGYFWGSINTHRYQILHYAQKFQGKAFAVNYRKAPQYPWPCALQDVLAAYLYLIRPPPNVPHKPIPNSKIVFAGDSAGGGLCLSTLTVLRDLNIPMPAGAVLISPWVDLTHSFPSVMHNFETDIIPKHGFLAKPSTLWPLPTLPTQGGRVVPTVTNVPPRPGRADTLKPFDGLEKREREADSDVFGPGKFVRSQQEMLEDNDNLSTPLLNNRDHDVLGPFDESDQAQQKGGYIHGEEDFDSYQPKPPKILMENPNAVPLELRSQIQMYATTEQLTHPLVSPVLQGSLGNLPPLYIIAGEGEVLRDEIIYLAHRAAHPKDFQTRAGVLKSRRQKDNAENYIEPTKVHLQVFDRMCHVPTVFMFTKSARYAYRSVAEFVKHVTSYNQAFLKGNPFPELYQPPNDIPVEQNLKPQHIPNFTESFLHESKGTTTDNGGQTPAEKKRFPNYLADARQQRSPSPDIRAYLDNEAITVQEATELDANAMSSANSRIAQHDKDDTQHIPGVLMIRERVDLCGKVRPMEAAEKLAALQLDASEIGLLKEAPALRWASGQDLWDRIYSKRGERILKQKNRNEEKAKHMLQNALDQGFVHSSQCPINGNVAVGDAKSLRKRTSLGKIEAERRWGPLDLEDERPPPSAIAGRRDTPEALALLKKHIYFTAPVTHLTVPKLQASDAIRAAFAPDDDPNKAPPQSASEEQARARFIPVHGLRMWDNILRYVGRKTKTKAANGIDATIEKVGLSMNNR